MPSLGGCFASNSHRAHLFETCESRLQNLRLALAQVQLALIRGATRTVKICNSHTTCSASGNASYRSTSATPWYESHTLNVSCASHTCETPSFNVQLAALTCTLEGATRGHEWHPPRCKSHRWALSGYPGPPFLHLYRIPSNAMRRKAE